MSTKNCDNIIVFNPVRTNRELLKLLIKENFEFTVYFTYTIEELNHHLLSFLHQTNIKYYFYNPETFSFGYNDLLIPCDDESARLVENLHLKTANKFADNIVLSKIRVNKKEYLNYIDGKIIEKLEFPCVVKPIVSSGSTGTYILENEHDYVEVKDKLDLENSIIQPYFVGTEYCVDVISYAGVHHLVGIWRYCRGSAKSALKQKVEFVDNSQSEIINTIFSFIKKSLNKIGKQYGATHSEIIVDNNNTCSLVEINFRFHGKSLHEHYLKCSGDSHFSAYIKKIIKNDTLPEVYQSRDYAAKILINLRQQLQLTMKFWNFIKNLKSVVSVIEHPALTNDYEYGPTVDVPTVLGYIMVYDNHTTFNDDLEKIKLWEEMLYVNARLYKY